MLHVPKTKRLGPPTEALGYPRQPGANLKREYRCPNDPIGYRN
jgi:hypothetical protein